MPVTTYYDRLGVPFKAPLKMIKKAYHEKAKEYHPDRHPPDRRDWAREQFHRIERAYEVLSDPRERALYDRELMEKGSVPIEKEEFWTFWRQFLSKNDETSRTMSYHEKMVMDSYAEDWLEEMHGGTAHDRHKYRKHLNFGKMHLAQNNLAQARTEFIRADTICQDNILSKFYVGYCKELRGNYEEALQRYEYAVDIGLSRPREYVNKCLKIRERMVELYELIDRYDLAKKQQQLVGELEHARYGFDQFLQADSGLSRNDSRTWRRKFLGWLASKLGMGALHSSADNSR